MSMKLLSIESDRLTGNTRRDSPRSISCCVNTRGLEISEENVLSLFHICKLLNILVFLDKEENPHRLRLKTVN